MKNLSLAGAVSVIVVANALALLHAARNRAGSPEAELTLTQRELRYLGHPASDEDSGVTLQMEWTDPGNLPAAAGRESASDWLGPAKLRELGFDCSVHPTSADATEFYQHQRAREAYVALENDGPSFQSLEDANGVRALSHLVGLDMGPDAAKLRARYPDRKRVVILPAVIAVNLNLRPNARAITANRLRVRGAVRQLPSVIYVPRPFSDPFRGHGAQASYRVHLRYGTSFEPWITKVEFGALD